MTSFISIHMRAWVRKASTISRLPGIAVLVVIGLLAAGAGDALGVVGGRTVSIAEAPWNVVVWERYALDASYAACTGVIIGREYVLTAGHCVMVSDSSVTPQAASAFSIEAGVSNFKHPRKSDHPQWRSVGTVSTMQGYIATNNRSFFNENAAYGDDLAVLKLTKPLDLNGADAQEARLPSTSTSKPWSAKLVMAGFGDESPTRIHDPTGDLREIINPMARKGCSSSDWLCVYSPTGTCWGDSGAGILEQGPRPTVLGVLSSDEPNCGPGLDYYAPLTRPAALRFIKTST